MLAQQLEAVVLNYFRGVDQKNFTLIQSCFGERCIIRDVCALSATHHNNDDDSTAAASGGTSPQAIPSKTVKSSKMVQRCREFCEAHPDVQVLFHVPPTCLRTTLQNNTETDEPPPQYWVFAHWYELGTWSGTSCGISPPSSPGVPMQVEGQTRFRCCPDTLTIQELVVTRTFTDWEKAFLLREQSTEQST